LRAIRLFTSKIADSVIEGRALATEHDFTADKVKDDEAPVEDITEEYSQYVDPKYAEQIMQESLMMGDDAAPSGRKGPASETGAADAAEANQV
jgi:small subunit ribosomal protein S2